MDDGAAVDADADSAEIRLRADGSGDPQSADPSRGRDREPPGAPRGRSRGLRGQLRLALREHRSPFVLATGLFAIGLLGGLGTAAAGIDLLELLGRENALPEDAELTVEYLLLNNSWVLLLLVAGALTLGLLTALLLGYNGLLVGWVVGWIADDVGIGLLLALLLPHGIFELPGFWLGGAVAFGFARAAIGYVRGARERFLTRGEAGRTVLLALLAWALIAVAAVVEVYVTPAVAEAIFGSAETGGL